MKHNRMFWGGSGFAYSMLVVVALVESGLYTVETCAVCCAIGIVLMYGALALEELHFREEREKSKASVYSNWDKGFNEEQKPDRAYGKSFHSLNIRELLVRSKEEKCPRCGAPLWRKEGVSYVDKIGNKAQLWKCLRCKYEEERFA